MQVNKCEQQSDDVNRSSSDRETSSSDNGTDNSTSDSDAESEGKKGADAGYKTELIMPWHIQNSVLRRKGKRENSLIMELNKQDMTSSTANRGMNCTIQSTT
jgi:hypothetical protein